MPKTNELTCADCPWMHACPVDERWWGDKDGSGRFSWPPEATGECPIRRIVRVMRDAHRELRVENELQVQEVASLQETLAKIQAVGFNKDCLFCGFKDKEIKKALGTNEETTLQTI